MASSSSTRGTSSRAAQQPEGGQEAAAQLYRRNLTLLTQSAAAVFRGAEVWQQAQLEMLGRTRASLQEAADNIPQARDPVQMLTIQTNLLYSGWAQLMQ